MRAPASARVTALRGLPQARRQGGFSLIVSLMMLIVVIILGVSASQMSINEERAARNDRDRQIAFQAAEAALKDAEFEILGGPVACSQAGQPPSRGRPPVAGQPQTCFNQDNSSNYVTAAPPTLACSVAPNEGLCAGGGGTNPDWMNVDFLADAKGASTIHTVEFGRFTGRKFGAQTTTSINPGVGTGMPASLYPPRYIIEIVPKNVSTDTLTTSGSGGGQGTYMFRVTAMGFGASGNSQVVLQTVVATQN